MNGQVVPRFKALVVCACGCGDEGPPRRKPWLNGMHTRGCECRRCLAGGFGKSERRRVRRFARRSGLTAASGSGRHLGYDLTGVCAVEETAGAAVVDGFRGWWDSKAVQEKVRRVRGQKLRPWALVLSWNEKARLVVMDADGFAELCDAACSPDDLPVSVASGEVGRGHGDEPETAR